MQETLEEFMKRLYYGQVDFEQLAEWYYSQTQENAIMRNALNKIANEIVCIDDEALDIAREALEKANAI